MIEFSCPSCQAQIRVADGAGGKKGTCPQCKSKLIVPHESETTDQATPPEEKPAQPPASNLSFEFKPADTPPDQDASWEKITHDSVPAAMDNTTAPIIDIKPEDKPGTTVRSSRRRKKPGGGLVVPLVCAAILLGVIGYYFWQTHTGLSPDVVGTVVADPQIPNGLIAFGNVSVDKETFEKVRIALQSEELSLVSSTHLADVALTGNISGIIVKVKPVSGAVCVKISIDGTKVKDYVSDHAKEFNEYRMQRIKETADKFVTEWAAAVDSGKKDISNLNEIRNDMALASVVSGFGYHIVAWDGKTASPCVGVDTSGDLYFFVKPGTKSFIIRGRDLQGDTPGFPGEIVVQVNSPTSPATPVPSQTPKAEPDSEQKENETEMKEDQPEDKTAFTDAEKPHTAAGSLSDSE